MNNLHSIIYTSTAVHLMHADEIDRLLSSARQRNRQHGVTGLLLYCTGCFMQYIEGPHDNLMSIYQIILQDPMHHTIIELQSKPVRTRGFESWAMAYSRAQEAELKSLLEADWTGRRNEPDGSDASQSRQLLVNFWRSQNRFSE